MKLCVYCGKNEATTVDHVPPRGLFPKPRPSTLITAPCCEACRQGQSLDDEYFIRALAMRHDVEDNPAAAKVLEKVQRAFAKPSKRGFARSLINTVKPAELFSRGGVYIGRSLSYHVEYDRLTKVMERTTLGLYHHVFGDRLPETHMCVTYAAAGIALTDIEITESLQRVVDFALRGRIRVIGDKTYAFCVNQIEECATVWLHLLYERVAFIAYTLPLDQCHDENPV